MLIGLLGYLLLPSSPCTATFLNPREQFIASQRMRREYNDSANHNITARHVKRAIANWNNTFCALGFFLLNITVQGFSVFLVSYPWRDVVNFTSYVTLAKPWDVYTSVADDLARPWLDSHQSPALHSSPLRGSMSLVHTCGLPLRPHSPPWCLPYSRLRTGRSRVLPPYHLSTTPCRLSRCILWGHGCISWRSGISVLGVE